MSPLPYPETPSLPKVLTTDPKTPPQPIRVEDQIVVNLRRLVPALLRFRASKYYEHWPECERIIATLVGLRIHYQSLLPQLSILELFVIQGGLHFLSVKCINRSYKVYGALRRARIRLTEADEFGYFDKVGTLLGSELPRARPATTGTTTTPARLSERTDSSSNIRVNPL